RTPGILTHFSSDCGGTPVLGLQQKRWPWRRAAVDGAAHAVSRPVRRVMPMGIDGIGREERREVSLVRGRVVVLPVRAFRMCVADSLQALEHLQRAQRSLRAVRRQHIAAVDPDDVWPALEASEGSVPIGQVLSKREAYGLAVGRLHEGLIPAIGNAV